MATITEAYSQIIVENILSKYEKEAITIQKYLKDGMTREATELVTELYTALEAKIEAANKELERLLNDVAAKLKLQNYKIKTRIKPLKSVIDKVINRKYKFSKMADLVAGSIYATESDGPEQAFKYIQKKYKVVGAEHKSKELSREKKDSFGYHGTFHVDVELPSGFIGEIQLMTKKMQTYKDAAHAIYTANRSKDKKDIEKGELARSRKLFALGNKKVREALEELGIDDFELLESMVNDLISEESMVESSSGYVTKTQEVVVNARLKNGYTILGKTVSLTNGLDAFVMNKGKHQLVINSLGYDEHTTGKTWKIHD